MQRKGGKSGLRSPFAGCETLHACFDAGVDDVLLGLEGFFLVEVGRDKG
jgi:hypothetical protein